MTFWQDPRDPRSPLGQSSAPVRNPLLPSAPQFHKIFYQFGNFFAGWMQLEV